MVDVAERRKPPSSKKLCFNCPGTKIGQQNLLAKGYVRSAVENTTHQYKPQVRCLTATGEAGEGTVTYSVVLVIINGIKCRALLDTYASEALIRRLGKTPARREH